jgi:hypothetical protein
MAQVRIRGHVLRHLGLRAVVEVAKAAERRWRGYRQRAAFHADREQEFRLLSLAADQAADEAGKIGASGLRSDGDEDLEDRSVLTQRWEGRAAHLRAMASYHEFLRRKYERAATRPWLAIPPDPPPPP